MFRRLLVLLIIVTASTSVQADNYSDMAQFAQSICGDIPAGRLTRTTIQGKVQANAGELAKIISGDTNFSASKKDDMYKGIPFDKLPDNIPTVSMCKLELVKLLKDNLLVSPRQINERDAIQHLIDSICDRGVLQNDYSWEVPEAVYASVGEIRNELGNALGQLATDSAARQPLQTMQRASRMLLQDPTVFPDGPRGLPRPISGPLRDAIHKFRTVFSQNTTQIVQIYALKGNCDLSSGLEAVPSR